jgi:uncharacterized membrane protein YfcA
MAIVAEEMVGGAAGKAGAGLLLPMLCAADCFAVAWYRRHARWDMIVRLIPFVAVGIAGGYLVLGLSDATLTPLIGGLVLAMITLHVVRKRVPEERADPDQRIDLTWPASLVFGTIAGFATTVANAAGPVMNLYLLSMGLPKDQFMGTGAWYFFLINLAKVPIYASRGMITPTSLAIDAWLLPAIVAGALTGRWLYARLPQKLFERVVLAIAAVASAKMLVPHW